MAGKSEGLSEHPSAGKRRNMKNGAVATKGEIEKRGYNLRAVAIFYGGIPHTVAPGGGSTCSGSPARAPRMCSVPVPAAAGPRHSVALNA